MVNITMSLPDDLKKEMEKRSEINWSEVARQAIKRKILILKEMDEALSESELSEEEAVKLGRKVNRKLAKKYKK